MLTCVDSEEREERLQRVKELEEFAQNCRRKVEEIFTELKWKKRESECGGDAEEELVQCPFDPGHTVPLRRLQRHKDTCLLKKMDYSSDEQEQMPDSSFCYKNTNVKTFIMDKDTQQQVISQARAAAPLMKMEGIFWQGHYSSEPSEVPQNHKRALCDLTVADRLALYDHVTRHLSNQGEPAPSCSNEDLYVDLVKKLQKEEEQKEPKTQLELMAEMRDYKRRRQSYRAKNVHITKKSYTEVIREVINVHSEELSRQWREEEREEAGAERRRHRERSHERQRDGESKKKKKKRQRDSRSPDDHRERKKKKKKRKREECEEREDE